jgi:hypothetical protein
VGEDRQRDTPAQKQRRQGAKFNRTDTSHEWIRDKEQNPENHIHALPMRSSFLNLSEARALASRSGRRETASRLRVSEGSDPAAHRRDLHQAASRPLQPATGAFTRLCPGALNHRARLQISVGAACLLSVPPVTARLLPGVLSLPDSDLAAPGRAGRSPPLVPEACFAPLPRLFDRR